ncbi:MAG: hypothetical protein PHV74_08200 [Dehalococcoidia bacterium]|nr:hypothetical protein [Dehalococcoidia bacterium]
MSRTRRYKQKVAFVYLGETHSEYEEVANSLASQGIESHLIHLDHLEMVDWSEFDMVNIRECRGYHLDPAFLTKIEALHHKLLDIAGKAIPLVNPLEVVRAGLDKGKYLRQLEQDGIDIIPTCWLKSGDAMTLERVMAENGWAEVVVKPAISSRCWNTFRVSKHGEEIVLGKAEDALHGPAENIAENQFPEHELLFQQLLRSQDVCVQKFIPEVLRGGETSFVFINDTFSHAVQKTVADQGGWLAHEMFGGANEYRDVSGNQVEWAENIYAKLSRRYGRMLYARVDGIEENGLLRLLECELVVPRLFLREGDAFHTYTKAIKNWLLDPHKPPG